MSIIQTLKKIVDPARAREEAAERKAAREEVRQQEAGDVLPRYRCSVCGHEADQGTYCPECIADTMEYVGPPGQDDHGQEAVTRPPSCQGCKKSGGKNQ